MKRSMLGVLAAGAVASLLGSTAMAAGNEGGGGMGGGMGMGDAKACYRMQCGKSVKGHAGKCGGTMVEGISAEKMCMDAGGAWTTEKDAEQYKKNDKDK